mmetsp:Transcript_22351/g.63350  ORF Transcript_22351/g.63350 Transcript_22351/m.63350 type:complete len:480 (+) Transcript_22351:151-1590(+)|eukprot:CAMPEP_0119560310 /NCGR_PEP_ID=MMETSP1352-20130426/14548_1 /TAXON_ID=265584 /ORGANISM="Stauroneis constricta, Strain CCMP1120" /LENGTH=479 /DNA_ID=CAMNT_0007608265 /DNA_START=80 /DNA_END=1519 /DNA_ORIENTATION=+
MKFINTAVAVAVAALVAMPLASANQQECVTTVDPMKDYFPDKVESIEASVWSMEYFNTYKVLTVDGMKYALYQCGTEPPTGDDFESVVPVPVTEVVLSSTTQIPYVEVFGERDTIVGGTGTFWDRAPECFVRGEDEGIIKTGLDASNATELIEMGIDPDTAVYIGTSPGVFKNHVRSRIWGEKTSEASSEWRKVYGALFNKEKEANEAFQNTLDSHACVEKNAAFLADDNFKTIVWGSWASFANGWDVAREGSYYYNELARICAADLLTGGTDGGGSISLFGRTYMTTEEFAAFAMNASAWIYPADDLEVYLNDTDVFSDAVKAIPAFQSGEVYDVQGTYNAWFNVRQLEADVLLEDFCAVAGTISADGAGYTRRWFRNVFDESIAEPKVCIDYDAPLVVNSSPCFDLTATMKPSASPSSVPTMPPTSTTAAPTAKPVAAPSADDATTAPTSAASTRMTATATVLFFAGSASFLLAFSL